MILKDWIKEHDNVDDITMMINSLAVLLKKYHSMGYCVKYIHPSFIVADDTGNFDFTDKFFPDKAYYQEIVSYNIYTFAIMEMSFYLGSYDRLIDPVLLRDNFNSVKNKFPNEYISYYKDILDGDITYRNINVGTGNERSRALVKSTDAGRLYSLDDNDGYGFANVLVFPVVILIVVIIAIVIISFIGRF